MLNHDSEFQNLILNQKSTSKPYSMED